MGVLKLAAASGALKNTTPYPGQEMAKPGAPAKMPAPTPGGGTSGSPTFLGLSPGNPSPTVPTPPYQMPVLGSQFGTQGMQRAPEQLGATAQPAKAPTAVPKSSSPTAKSAY